MKYRFTLMLLLLLSACNGMRSPKAWADDWIGVDFNTLKLTRKNKSILPYIQAWRDSNISGEQYLKNGNIEYVQPITKGCTVHWEIDKKTNKILSYQLEGKRCN